MARGITVNSRSVANAVRGIFSGGEEAGAAERRALLNEDLIGERILEARRKRQQEDAAAAAYAPDAIEGRLPLETGASREQVRNVLQAIPGGDVPQVPGTEITPDQAGPRMPIEGEIVDRVRRAAARSFDPLSRAHPQRVADAQRTSEEAARKADLVKRAATGKLTAAELNRINQAERGLIANPFAVQGDVILNRETGADRGPTLIGDSRIGANLQQQRLREAQAKEVQSRIPANQALASQRTARADLSKRTDPNIRRGPAGLPDREARMARKDAVNEARVMGLTGEAFEAHVADRTGEARRREPLPGTAPSEPIRRQFQADPNMKGKRIGSYERGKGYAVYDGKRIIGYVNEGSQ